MRHKGSSTLADRTRRSLQSALGVAQRAEKIKSETLPIIEKGVGDLQILIRALEELVNVGGDISSELAAGVAREKEEHELLQDQVDYLADIDQKVFNAWAYLLDPAEWAVALENITPEYLAEGLALAEPKAIQKLKDALEDTDGTE